MKFVFSADESVLKELLEEMGQDIVKAKEGAVQDAAAEALRLGRANIAGAGFPSRWQQGLRSKVYLNKDTGNPMAVVYHRINYASVFEKGAAIGGKPLLWLPIRKNLPSGIRSPKKYGKKLISVNVAGKPPMLFDAEDRKRGPLFFGVRTVTIKPRWNLRSIFAGVFARFQEFYEARIGKKQS